MTRFVDFIPNAKSWITNSVARLSDSQRIHICTRIQGSPSFQVFGYSGFLLGFAQSLLLVKYLGLSLWTQLGIAGVVILTFYTLLMVTKIVAGEEVMIYYHHEIAVIATTSIFLRIVHQPALPYLDVTILGVGLFLAGGRIGCLMVGCCHGRPSRWGVTYGADHVDQGFPRYLAGVRLFPIQAVESVFAFVLVTIGIIIMCKGMPAGSAFGLYIVGYAMGRFSFEFFRGDAARPYLYGLSEAQWISLAAVIVECLGEYTGLLPYQRWHSVVAVLLWGTAAAVVLWRHQQPVFSWICPQQIREIASAIQLSERFSVAEPARPDNSIFRTIHLAETSRGLCITCSKVICSEQNMRLYCLSHSTGNLPPAFARCLAIMISRLCHSCQPFELLPGKPGIFYVIFSGRELFDQTGKGVQKVEASSEHILACRI